LFRQSRDQTLVSPERNIAAALDPSGREIPGGKPMVEIHRRAVLGGMLYGAAFVTAGGVAVVTAAKPANAVPLAKPEAVPLAQDKAGAAKSEDPVDEQDRVEGVLWRPLGRWRRRHRRRWRRRHWW
jgi:hypothetical protein